MDLIVDKMVQLEVIHITYRNGVIKGSSRTSVIKRRLTVLIASGFN